MKKIGIYIHIPFCIKKCKYCDFISFENKLECENEYINALIKSINQSPKTLQELLLKSNQKEVFLKNIIVDTIYFGGGTPSCIDSKLIVQTLNAIKKSFLVEKNAEITIEINPGTATKEKLEDYLNAGFNRISIGLQSSKNELLKTLGRIHDFKDFLNTYNLAKNIGFNNINVDLMLGLPNQTVDDLKESLKEVIKLKPNHISIYSLIVEENTVLEKEISQGKLVLPTDELERKMYHTIKKILNQNQYEHYEISNFALKGFESKHNLNCWSQCEYLGFGLASHSYLENIRFSNISDYSKYIENIDNNKNIDNIEVLEIQNKESQMKEYMMLGFRKIKGISISEFEQRFGINPLFYFRFEISKLVDKRFNSSRFR